MISPADVPLLFGWYCDFESTFIWHLDRRVRSYRKFADMVLDLVTGSELSLIEDNENQPVGCTLLYASRPSDGWSHLALYLPLTRRDFEIVEEAAKVAIARAFHLHASLRKIYMETYDFMPFPAMAFEKIGFIQEAVTPEHFWFYDRFWARRRLALYRARWEADGSAGER